MPANKYIKACIVEECSHGARFGFAGQQTHCSKHKSNDMRDPYRANCQADGCDKSANFGFENQKKTYCGIHKLEGMVGIRTKKCQFEGCKTAAGFGVEGKPSHCANHKDEGMIAKKTKTCEVDGCSTSPTFGKDGKKTHCAKHKTSDMVNNHHTCRAEDCYRNPSFGIGGEISYCSKHRTSEMSNFKEPSCESPECAKVRPSFDFDGCPGRFCNDHKLPGMVNVISPICSENQCPKRAYYRIPGCPVSKCGDHKTAEMVSRENCQEPGCLKYASYKYPNGGRQFCTEHKKEGMMIRMSKTCLDSDCAKRPSYGFPNDPPLYCVHHKKNGMEDLVSRRCASDGCEIICNGFQFCANCDPDLSRKPRVKEMKVAKFLQEHFEIKWTSWNRQIDNGRECGCLSRPDFCYDNGTHITIIEVDENQHKDRVKECEDKRMVDIFNSFGGIPVHFIRFNPDDYWICMNSSKKRVKDALERRLSRLLEILRFSVSNQPKHVISLTKLFFDNQQDEFREDLIVEFDAFHITMRRDIRTPT